MPVSKPFSSQGPAQKSYGTNDLESGSAKAKQRRHLKDVTTEITSKRQRQDLLEKINRFDGKAWEHLRKSEEEIKQIPNKRLRKFYETQNSRLNDWLEVDSIVAALADDILESFDPQDRDNDGVAEERGALLKNGEHVEDFLPKEEQEKRAKEAKYASWAINVNVAANVVLLIAKSVAVLSSNSISLIATLVDSALDLLCTLIIFSTSKLVQWKSAKLSTKYPVGRRRLEPLGITVFSIIMVISFLQILQESFGRLTSDEHKLATLPPIAVGAIAGTIGLKGLIWFACFWQSSTQVQALAQDCKTDVLFHTASLLFPAIGIAANIWWLDALGAGLLSIFIVIDWAGTCLENVNRLSGAVVSDEIQMKLMLLAWRFSPLVDAFKHINAYHAGDGVWVEVDIILDEKTDLRTAHDISECMQYCFEGLQDVDRAFVSVDYSIQGPKGHAQ